MVQMTVFASLEAQIIGKATVFASLKPQIMVKTTVFVSLEAEIIISNYGRAHLLPCWGWVPTSNLKIKNRCGPETYRFLLNV